jgi:hypothetical protein
VSPQVRLAVGQAAAQRPSGGSGSDSDVASQLAVALSAKALKAHPALRVLLPLSGPGATGGAANGSSRGRQPGRRPGKKAGADAGSAAAAEVSQQAFVLRGWPEAHPWKRTESAFASCVEPFLRAVAQQPQVDPAVAGRVTHVLADYRAFAKQVRQLRAARVLLSSGCSN